jgi:ribosomal protein S18 acetylase RimI-like enzyme
MPVVTFQIRRYVSSDHPAIWELHMRALGAAGAAAEGAEAERFDADFRDIEHVYLHNRGEFLVGLCDNRIVAMGALKRLNATAAEITRMRVHPDYWRRGFGRAVLDRLQVRAIELGYQELWLDTTLQQIAAQQLYLKNGFREFRRFPVGAFEVILFEKDLLEHSEEAR